MQLYLNSDAAIAVFAIGVSASIAIGTWGSNKAQAEIAISCNNLKAAAIAASQPEPVCSSK